MAPDDASKPKKSLFTRPLFKRPLAAKKPDSNSDDTDLFRRADKSYVAVVEDTEKKLKKRAAKVARREEELRQREIITGIAEKRRRISPSSDESSSESESETGRKSSETRSSPYSPPHGKGTYSSTNSNAINDTSSSTLEPEVVNLLDEDSQETIAPTRAESQTALDEVSSCNLKESKPLQDLFSEDEDEEPELDVDLAASVRRAREAARLKKEASLSIKRERSLHDGEAMSNRAQKPVVFVVVESPLPGTESRRFKVPLDKRLRSARLRWCSDNDYYDEEAQKIVLVFLGQRVFDVSTLASLGIETNDEEVAFLQSGDPLDSIKDGEVHMTAVQEDYLETYIKEWKAKRGIQDPAYEQDLNEEVQAEQEALPAKPQERKVKIICQAKGLPDFKVAVYGSTPVSRLQYAFLHQHELPKYTQTLITFDGESLHPSVTIDDLGLEDMDRLDVQVKSSGHME